MTKEQLEHELGKASQKFYMHKFKNLHQMSSWKQEFMLSVLDIFINHSYLAGQMKAAIKEGKEMPDEVRQLLETVKGAAKARMDDHPALAPIP
jgi:anaerobic magnesium-protoporphyrin IX monomethyl ester cyclase